MNLKACLIHSREELAGLAPEWNSLLRESQADSIFLSWEWISSWLDSVYPEAGLFVVVVRDENRNLVALLPLYQTEFRLLHTLNFKYLRCLGDCHSGAEYADVIVRNGFEKDALNAISQCLFDHRDKWQCVYLPNIAGWTGAFERFHSVFQGTNLSFFNKRKASFSSIALPGTWKGFEMESLSRKPRTNIRRHEKRMTSEHDVRLVSCDNETDLNAFLDVFFGLHRKRWESVGQSGSFVRRPLMENFYRRFTPKALANGWLSLFGLEVDGEISAVQYGFVYGNKFLSLQEGFDPQGPPGLGIVLRNRVMMWCIENKIEEYDFLGVHSQHKQNWGAEERWGWHLFLGRKCLKNLPLSFKEVWPSGRYIEEGLPVNGWGK